METKENTLITVEAIIDAPVQKVWKLWTEPLHIRNWNNANDDWHTPSATNDLREGGKFTSRMEAKDGSVGFDFEGTYSKVVQCEAIEYFMPDDRKVKVTFQNQGSKTIVTEIFHAENSNPVDLQKMGWQAILDNFKKYVESSDNIETLHFDIKINASAEKVYKVMLDEKHYKEWTEDFDPDSYYQGSWDIGSKILFLSKSSNGGTMGLVSRIKENIPNKFISIEHMGIVKNSEEITTGPEIKGWQGALENYTYSSSENGTILTVDVDVSQQYKPYFLESWPKALKALKSICENLN